MRRMCTVIMVVAGLFLGAAAEAQTARLRGTLKGAQATEADHQAHLATKHQ